MNASIKKQPRDIKMKYLVKARVSQINLKDNFYYYGCPICLKKVTKESAGWKCPFHLTVKEHKICYKLQMTLVDPAGLDPKVNVIAFDHAAQSIIGQSAEQLKKLHDCGQNITHLGNTVLNSCCICVLTVISKESQISYILEEITPYNFEQEAINEIKQAMQLIIDDSDQGLCPVDSLYKRFYGKYDCREIDSILEKLVKELSIIKVQKECYVIL